MSRGGCKRVLVRPGTDVLSMAAISFFCNVASTSEIYTLSLHDALPILNRSQTLGTVYDFELSRFWALPEKKKRNRRSEEHTSELQSRLHLVCRLLLEKKKLARSSGAEPSPTWCVPAPIHWPWRPSREAV